jgi:predicted O-linked N-acetylglucosamine transferase (SPINDLY family)
MSLPKAPSPNELNQLGILFNTGRYTELESRAGSLLSLYPNSGFIWQLLGSALLAQGKDALHAFRRAAELMPDDAEAHYNLGVDFTDLGKLDDAVASYRRAVKLKPNFAFAHNNLGYLLHTLGQPDAALASCRRAVGLKPDYAEAHNNLGNALQALGQPGEAVASYRRALALKPDYAEAHNNLGITLKALGQPSEAVASYRRALALKPGYAEAHNNLGNALKELGQLDEATVSYRQAIALKPDYAEAHYNLGTALNDLGQFDDAVSSYRHALQIKPDYAEAHNNLGVALQELGQLDDAVASYRRAQELRPDLIEAHNNLGNALKDLGQLDDAVASCRRALELKPDFAEAYSNLLFTLNYHPDLGAEEIYRAYQDYDAQRGIPLRSTWRAHDNDKNPHRRLRVGYVSPDFRHHSGHSFLEPLLAHHDKTRVEVYAYAELTRKDDVTARYKSYVEHWIPTKGMNDEALAERIRADGIDILVELAGHTAGNRLLTFARKPAPVSLSWLGFGYTTGLNAIDYFLTDEVCVPDGSEKLFAEQPWRIATPVYAYRPNPGMGEVGSLPARQRGYITFGTLTRAVRINHRTIRIWSELLKAVPNSRLVIDSGSFKDPAMQERMAAKFVACGISRERLEIGCHSPPWDVLRGIDIGLDCFPHNSGTTLFETLYMGVPYITLAGRPPVGRLGSTILQGAGHPEWIAASEDDYVAKAIALASDLGRLEAQRALLRAEMDNSPLRDEAGFAEKVETAYREMWELWCAKHV